MIDEDDHPPENGGDGPEEDPFFSGVEPEGAERINAFDIDEHGRWLEDHGYEPGDIFPVRWEDPSGTDYETGIRLPHSDLPLTDPDYPWDVFYEEMRDFFEDVWGDTDSPSGGSATGG